MKNPHCRKIGSTLCPKRTRTTKKKKRQDTCLKVPTEHSRSFRWLVLADHHFLVEVHTVQARVSPYEQRRSGCHTHTYAHAHTPHFGGGVPRPNIPRITHYCAGCLFREYSISGRVTDPPIPGRHKKLLRVRIPRAHRLEDGTPRSEANGSTLLQVGAHHTSNGVEAACSSSGLRYKANMSVSKSTAFSSAVSAAAARSFCTCHNHPLKKKALPLKNTTMK